LASVSSSSFALPLLDADDSVPFFLVIGVSRFSIAATVANFFLGGLAIAFLVRVFFFISSSLDSSDSEDDSLESELELEPEPEEDEPLSLLPLDDSSESDD